MRGVWHLPGGRDAGGQVLEDFHEAQTKNLAVLALNPLPGAKAFERVARLGQGRLWVRGLLALSGLI